MNSGSSAFIGSAGHAGEAARAASSSHTSRPSTQLIAPPVRRTTSTLCTALPAAAAISAALSAFAFSGTLRPPRKPSSAVISTCDLQSTMRPASESGEKPPNTTEWIAPMRVQASIA